MTAANTTKRLAALENLSREDKLKLIFRHTHPDFKNTDPSRRSILVLRQGQGTCSVPITALTEQEIADKLPYAISQEKKRLTK